MTFPAFDGAENITDKLVQPWYVSGWTAQAIPADTEPVQAGLFPGNPGAPLPSNLIYVNITALYYDFDNNPMSGFLTFQTSEGFTVASNGVTYRVPQRYAGRDNGQTPGAWNNFGSGRIYIRQGVLAVTLMCTQNVAIVTDSGNPLTYHVVEHFLNGQQFDIAIPDSAVSPTDLRSLAVPGSFLQYDYDPAFPLGIESYNPPEAPLVEVLQPPPLTDIDGGHARG